MKEISVLNTMNKNEAKSDNPVQTQRPIVVSHTNQGFWTEKDRTAAIIAAKEQTKIDPTASGLPAVRLPLF